MIRGIRHRKALTTTVRHEGSVSGSAARLAWSVVIRLWVISFAVTLATGSAGWLIWKQILASRAENPTYQLAALIQTGPEVEALPTGYLEELLGLSQDHPINLYRIPLAMLESRLLSSPCIAKAEVSRLPPKALKIFYEARQPVAVCADLGNALIDAEGTILPYQPYYRPRRLPQIYLGILPPPSGGRSSSIWGKRIPKPLAEQANALLTNALWKQVDLLWLDLSHGIDENLATRQIVVKCRIPQLDSQPWIRLSSSQWREGLSQLAGLCQQQELLKGIEVIDLRMPRMAILVPAAS